MKTILTLILPALIFLNYHQSFAQEGCKVLKNEIAGKYEGKCKNGLANGKGTAEGQDKYIGRFKNGLPHGQGKYIWSSGEVYEGSWRAGKKEGEGKLVIKKNGVDSTIYGRWENDILSKTYNPNPYNIKKTISVSRYSLRRVGDGQRVVIIIMQNGNPVGSVANLFISPSSGTSVTVGMNQGYENIVFPFTCKVTFTLPSTFRTSSHEVEFEFEILEEGNWDVVINN